jgi:hypothetical protein
MKQYLETVGEKIVVECARAMAEEAKRANILASMPKNAPGYKATERSFELERIREQKSIQKILHERDQKLAKATRFQRHIPPPTNPASWTDNEDWVNAVMKQAKILGIDPKVGYISFLFIFRYVTVSFFFPVSLSMSVLTVSIPLLSNVFCRRRKNMNSCH